jgi:transcription elongation factor Elf1
MGTRVGSQEQTQREQAVFQCSVCGARRVATAIEYDTLGYPICPVCTYAHSP